MLQKTYFLHFLCTIMLVLLGMFEWHMLSPSEYTIYSCGIKSFEKVGAVNSQGKFVTQVCSFFRFIHFKLLKYAVDFMLILAVDTLCLSQNVTTFIQGWRNRGARWVARPTPSDFCRSVIPISTQGRGEADYANHLIIFPLRFLDLPPSLLKSIQ